jgi:Fe2+ transport system protein FeoA
MMPLVMISEGEEARLVAIHGGLHLRRRLADLGLNIGMTVRVVRNNPHGPIILAVKDSRLALGWGMAHRVMVELV